MCEQERLAMFYFWMEVGRRMNIRNIPSEYEAFEQFNRDYEKTNFQYATANQRVGEATRDLFAGWFPSFTRPMVRSFICALLDDPLIEAFGFPRSSRFMCWLAGSTLRLRAFFVRWLPARRRPRLRTEMRHPSYPDGYSIDHLGPPVPDGS